MTSFSSIGVKPKAETPPIAAETRANAPIADTSQHAATDADADLGIGDGMNIGDFTDWMAAPRATKDKGDPIGSELDADGNEIPTAEPIDPKADTSEAGFAKRSWSWFRGAFDEDEGPVTDEMKVEFDEEMYGLTASLGTGFSDVVFPWLIAKMYGDRNADEFKAKEVAAEGAKYSEKERANHAWELFFRSKRIRVTPTSYLIGVLTQIYGLPMLGGLMEYWSRVGIFGFHWPWSDKWKVKAHKMQQAMEKAKGMAAEPEPAAAKPEPARPAPVIPSNEETKTPPPPAPPKEEKEICMYWQWQTDNGRKTTTPKEFPKGKGHPHTCKDAAMVGKFSSYTAYIGYGNSTKKLGPKK